MTTLDPGKKAVKVNSSGSTLNSTISYFPSLKCHNYSNNSPNLKNHNDTQRSLMESTAIAFSQDYTGNSNLGYSPTSNQGSLTSFIFRKALSNPRNGGSIDPEKDRLGREKLNKYHNRKHTDYQLTLLKNRIKKLAHEEMLVQRKIRETQRRADHFIFTRYKFDVDQNTKYENKYAKQIELQEKRERIRQERINSHEKKKQAKMNVISNNFKEGLNVKKTLYDGFRDRDMRLEEELNGKLVKIQQIKDYHKRHSLSKIERHELRNFENKQRVDIMMSKDDMRAQANLSQMKKLEKQEQIMMEKLKETMNAHQRTVQTLESMVSSNSKANRSMME